MRPAPTLADALARHGLRIHLAIPGDGVFRRAYAGSIRGDFHDPAVTAERERRELAAFASNVAMAAENRAFAESERDRLMRAGRPEGASWWSGWARFFADLQNVNQEGARHAA